MELPDDDRPVDPLRELETVERHLVAVEAHHVHEFRHGNRRAVIPPGKAAAQIQHVRNGRFELFADDPEILVGDHGIEVGQVGVHGRGLFVRGLRNVLSLKHRVPRRILRIPRLVQLFDGFVLFLEEFHQFLLGRLVGRRGQSGFGKGRFVPPRQLIIRESADAVRTFQGFFLPRHRIADRVAEIPGKRVREFSPVALRALNIPPAGVERHGVGRFLLHVNIPVGPVSDRVHRPAREAFVRQFIVDLLVIVAVLPFQVGSGPVVRADRPFVAVETDVRLRPPVKRRVPFRKPLEIVLAELDRAGAVSHADAVRPVRPEQMPVGRHEPPLPLDLFRVEPAGALELRTIQPSAVSVPVFRAGIRLQIGFFVGDFLREFIVRVDLSRPVFVLELPVAVDEREELLGAHFHPVGRHVMRLLKERFDRVNPVLDRLLPFRRDDEEAEDFLPFQRGGLILRTAGQATHPVHLSHQLRGKTRGDRDDVLVAFLARRTNIRAEPVRVILNGGRVIDSDPVLDGFFLEIFQIDDDFRAAVEIPLARPDRTGPRVGRVVPVKFDVRAVVGLNDFRGVDVRKLGIGIHERERRGRGGSGNAEKHAETKQSERKDLFHGLVPDERVGRNG